MRGFFPRIIGVIHLPRLPSITYPVKNSVGDIAAFAVEEARILEELGYDGAIIENFGDTPYLKRVSDPLTLSAFSVIAREVRKSVSIQVGINVLRNSGREAYSIAVATGSDFVRVNALSETIISDSGIIEAESTAMRDVRLNYPGVKVFADILVKHAGSLYYLSLKEMEAKIGGKEEGFMESILMDTVERGGADAIIVTGMRTGEPPVEEELKMIKKISPVPVYVGSGATKQNIARLLEHADGVIVGTSIKIGKKAGNRIDRKEAEEFIKAARGKI
ncbi:MAG: BtpA/SgcQ family protein [Fervidicoccaceae archaeon]